MTIIGCCPQHGSGSYDRYDHADATILASLLTELRLPNIARNWKRITEAAHREGWPGRRDGGQ
jgi:hypothetical protein